jgi:hypothetical protein
MAFLAQPVPAQTPAQVIALAIKKVVTGRVVYDVQEGQQHFAVTVAARGTLYREDVTYQGVRYVLGWQGSKSRFSCVTNAKKLVCHAGDPDNQVSRVMTRLTSFLDSSFITQGFGGKNLKSASVTQSREAGQPVSCLSGKLTQIPVQLCVVAWGFPTRISGGSLIVSATSASQSVSQAEVGKPVTQAVAKGSSGSLI